MEQPKWRFAGLIVLIVGANLLAGYLSLTGGRGLFWPLCSWLATIFLIGVSFGVIGALPSAPNVVSPGWRGVLIDQRGRISLSRMQLILWSVLVISGIITEGVVNAIRVKSNPLDLAIPAQLWILLGFSSATAVAAPIVLGTKGAALYTKQGNDPPAWRDIFYGDDNANFDQVDFSKVQQFFLTVVLITVYSVSLGAVLLNGDPTKSLTFPQLDPGFIGIMGVSQAAYIAYKALPQSQTNA